MNKGAMKEPVTSTPAWDELEEWTRGRIQEWMQQMLVDEVTDFLGRAKHQRRGVDMQGYRNGYDKPRRLTMRSGTITVRLPRVRDLDERFESRPLPLFTRRTNEVRDLLPDLYLHGLASGDFELALSGLLGDQAALSASTVARVKERWQAEYREWQLLRCTPVAEVRSRIDGTECGTAGVPFRVCPWCGTRERRNRGRMRARRQATVRVRPAGASRKCRGRRGRVVGEIGGRDRDERC